MINGLKPFAIAAAIASIAGSARAATLAGWDFSQWYGSGTLSTDGTTLTNRLAANYSNLDPTDNAGAESAQYGTLYFDGQFGASNVVPEGTGNEIFQPTAGSLVSNLNAPVTGPGTNPFDSLGILASEGQPFTQLLGMGAIAPVQVVFEAGLAQAPFSASNWRMTFGGRATGQANVVVDFSNNGVDYYSVGTVVLGNADTPYTLALGNVTGRGVFVRLGFQQAAGAGTSFIDNVAVQADLQGVVPEPTSLVLLLMGLSGLAAVRVRRA